MGGVSRSFRRISDRSGDAAKVGDIRYFERDPGSNWIVCDGRTLAATAENKRLFAPDTSSLSAVDLGAFGSPASPNTRGATLGDNIVIPQSSGGVAVFRSGDRGKSWSQTLGLGSGNQVYDTIAFKGLIVMSFADLATPIRTSPNGGVWSSLGRIAVGGKQLAPYRLKVVGDYLYASNYDGRELFRTADLVAWQMIPLPQDGTIDFTNEGGILDFDCDIVTNEWVFMTTRTDKQAFYRSDDLLVWRRINRLSSSVYSAYLSFIGNIWVASGGNQNHARVNGGIFSAVPTAFSNPPIWTGSEFAGSGGSSGKIRVANADLSAFADKNVVGSSNNSPTYFVYQFDDGDLLSIQTYATNNQRVATSRAVRAPAPPPVRPGITKGKPYVRIR